MNGRPNTPGGVKSTLEAWRWPRNVALPAKYKPSLSSCPSAAGRNKVSSCSGPETSARSPSSPHVRRLPPMPSNSTDALAYRRNEDRASYGVPISIICPAIALLLVVLRIYTRAFLNKKVFWEDYAIVAATVFSICLSVLIVIGTLLKTQLPQAMHTAQQLIAMDILWQLAPAIHIGYGMTHLFLKLSIVLQYIRISVMNVEKRLCYAFVAIIISGTLSFLIATLTACTPVYAIWTPNVPGAVCINSTASFTANQVYQILMDFAILILQRSTTSTDRTWDKVPSGLYAIIEVNVGITCSCIVTLRPLFGRWRWLSNGRKSEPPQAITPARKPPRPMDPFSLGTDSTQVLTVSDDVELGAVHTASYGGSTRAGSRAEEDGEAAIPAWPAPPPAAQCESAAPRCRSDDGQHTSQRP
ncbi:hypothetical protein MAPG_01680 [Magnaporthiopsis poae ATCC 64411]|uniref:Rhodopsin domain-containing protein n=1 Tax=Magnaporthiopsis poae (strain ATCC 64411 / 73-15) TaxID=644358 RepID=A0A0C4DPB9_MAGP6|nr:hypothetical protein MAPG_01680 [Magnaporthiopsis poae ATCC 64411]